MPPVSAILTLSKLTANPPPQYWKSTAAHLTLPPVVFGSLNSRLAALKSPWISVYLRAVEISEVYGRGAMRKHISDKQIGRSVCVCG